MRLLLPGQDEHRIDVGPEGADAFENAFAESMWATLTGVPGLRRSLLMRPAKPGQPYVSTMEFDTAEEWDFELLNKELLMHYLLQVKEFEDEALRPTELPDAQARAVEAGRALPLEDGVPAESVNALYPRLMARNRRAVAAFTGDASFRDIGTPADYLRTSVELAAREGDRLAGGARLDCAPSARLERTAVWDDVAIGERAELVDCIVCDGARIPDHARYERCAIVAAKGRAPAASERIDGDPEAGARR